MSALTLILIVFEFDFLKFDESEAHGGSDLAPTSLAQSLAALCRCPLATLGNTDCDINPNRQNVELGTISINSTRGRLRSWLISSQEQLDEDMFLGKGIGLKVGILKNNKGLPLSFQLNRPKLGWETGTAEVEPYYLSLQALHPDVTFISDLHR